MFLILSTQISNFSHFFRSVSNVFEKRIPDFDGDGVVGKSDLRLLIGVYGSREGEANYRTEYDLDGDGVIAKGDLRILIGSYGQTVSPSDGNDEGMVAISDMNLRAVIEDSLGKARGAPITREDMSHLTRVSAGSANISDLTGLEFATNLLSLYLYNNSISDVSVLSGLTNLTYLRLENNSITNLSPLVANTGLGSGDQDQVDVQNNPLSTTSINTHIPALQNRGVTVQF